MCVVFGWQITRAIRRLRERGFSDGLVFRLRRYDFETRLLRGEPRPISPTFRSGTGCAALGPGAPTAQPERTGFPRLPLQGAGSSDVLASPRGLPVIRVDPQVRIYRCKWATLVGEGLGVLRVSSSDGTSPGLRFGEAEQPAWVCVAYQPPVRQ